MRRGANRTVPLLVPAVASLALGTWGGLGRIGWSLPAGNVDLVVLHGPLMVLGFLGTVIGLERAVALGASWGFVSPACTVAGVAMLLAGARQGVAEILLLLAAIVLVAVLGRLALRQVTIPCLLLVLAALIAAVGDLLWLTGLDVAKVAAWWTVFLVITIVAERLELAGLGRLDRRGVSALVFLIGLQVFGLGAELLSDSGGRRIVGSAYLATAAWLAFYDLARRTIRLPGLPRFVASALIAGYVWLGIGGVLALVGGSSRGLLHDAFVHAVLLGFVFSMIFAHAPIVFPALIGVPVPFRRRFYLHLVLLHIGLAVRVAGDLLDERDVARAGGLASATAIALFLAMTVAAAAFARRGRPVATRPMHADNAAMRER